MHTHARRQSRVMCTPGTNDGAGDGDTPDDVGVRVDVMEGADDADTPTGNGLDDASGYGGLKFTSISPQDVLACVRNSFSVPYAHIIFVGPTVLMGYNECATSRVKDSVVEPLD